MAVPVNIYVQTNEAVPLPVLGAVVGIYNPATCEEVSLTITDPAGRAAFLLEPGIYEARFQKLLHRFQNPARIEVTEDGPNGFVQPCTPLNLPAATDPYVCRCTGKFMSLENKPIAGVSVRVQAKAEVGTQTPKIVNGNLVSAEYFLGRTDANGQVSFDLPRGGEFLVTWAGDEDNTWNIKVPDRASANLIDLLFPAPVLLQWDHDDAPNDAVSLAVGERKTVRWTMRYSDFQDRPEGLGWMQLVNMSPDVVIATPSEGTMELYGEAPGNSIISGTTVIPPGAVSRVPTPDVQIPSLHVTVTG
jgi:hypothetical protein